MNVGHFMLLQAVALINLGRSKGVRATQRVLVRSRRAGTLGSLAIATSMIDDTKGRSSHMMSHGREG